MKAVYNISLKPLILHLLPPMLRKPRMLAWLYVLLLPVTVVHASALAAHEANLRRANYPTSRLGLEKLLNDLYDSQGGISVRNTADLVLDDFWYFQSEGEQDTYIYFNSESSTPQYLYFNSEGNNTPDLTLDLPDRVQGKKAAVEAILENTVPLGVVWQVNIKHSSAPVRRPLL